jgi:hypothetical protein
MRTAFSNMAWNTGSSSPGELEMTRSTSEVAVCCSSALSRSRVRSSSCFCKSAMEGTTTARSRRRLSVLDFRCHSAARLHSYADRRCAGLASGHATNAIDVTSPPSHKALLTTLRTYARGSERYHTRANLERGLDWAQGTKAQCAILRRLCPSWVKPRIAVQQPNVGFRRLRTCRRK